MTDSRPPWARRALLLVGASAAVVGVLGGLGRLGIEMPGSEHAPDHGPLLVLGLFGTVIGLERAVALGTSWGYGAGVLHGAFALATIAGVPGSPWLAALGGGALVVANAAIVRRQALAFTWLMLLGSVVLFGGSLAWALGSLVPALVPAWLAFFVLTIVAERLELSRLAPTPPWAPRLLVALAVAFALATTAACAGVREALPAMGGLLACLSLWQLRFDLARHTIRRPGLPRFVALGVLLGTGWLLVAGVHLAVAGLPPSGLSYDAALHAVLVGFVVSMVFSHAPIILPAVARIELPFHPGLYVPLAILHVSVAVRIAGDLGGDFAVRRVGGVGNALSLVAFAIAVLASRVARRR